MNRFRRLGAILPVVLACCTGGAGHERVGDRAWHDGRWGDAAAAYRAAGAAPRLIAKLADAELQGGMLTASAQDWTRLGLADSSSIGEAAAGLAHVADLAVQNGDSTALGKAISGLRQVAPSWPLGRLARPIGRLDALSPGEVQAVVPAMLAGADPASVDPLLLQLASADRAASDCADAVTVFESLLRRSAAGTAADTARSGLGWCELGLGLAALGASHPGDAERWFSRAAGADSLTPVARRALIGIGDARAGQGDSIAARQAWQVVATASVPPDSLTQLALTRLQQLVPSVIHDSAPPAPGRS